MEASGTLGSRAGTPTHRPVCDLLRGRHALVACSDPSCRSISSIPGSMPAGAVISELAAEGAGVCDRPVWFPTFGVRGFVAIPTQGDCRQTLKRRTKRSARTAGIRRVSVFQCSRGFAWYPGGVRDDVVCCNGEGLASAGLICSLSLIRFAPRAVPYDFRNSGRTLSRAARELEGSELIGRQQVQALLRDR